MQPRIIQKYETKTFIVFKYSNKKSRLTIMSSAQDLIKALSSEGEKSYASYSSQIYLTKHLTLAAPEVTSKFHNLEESAKSRLRPEAFDYVAGGCSTEKTMQANLSAFDHVSSLSNECMTWYPLVRVSFMDCF